MHKRLIMSMFKGYGPAAVLAGFCLTWSALPARGQEVAAEERYQQVRELDPVGYWPCDEGWGEAVRDRSGNKNHGTIYSVPWQDGFLNFENDFYQWIHIPPYDAYDSPTFSMGGWVYSRKEYNEKHFGVLIMGQPFKSGGGEDALTWAIWGGRIDTAGPMLRFGSTSSGPNLIEVAHPRQGDAIGSVEEGVELATGEWQHVIYTYDESGTGRLYLNGSLVHSAEDVPQAVAGRDFPFAIGGGRWGTSNLGGIQSLDGSVRDMVLFDRALEGKEVASLCETTRPEKYPSSPESSTEEPSPSPENLDELTATLRDEGLSKEDRAEAALALAELGEEAADAVPALVEVLETITEREGGHVPHIEDLLRNAVMRALLDIAPEKKAVRNLLGQTLAKPFLETLNLSKSYPDKIRTLIQEGRYMDALEALRKHFADLSKLPKLSDWGSDHTEKTLDRLRNVIPLRQEYFDTYLSRGFPLSDAHYNAYTQVDALEDGTTYLPVVERVSWKEVKTQYENNLKEFAEEEPDPEAPRGKWSRVKILEIAPDGSERESYLGGPWLIFNARDIKLDGWSIFADSEGYIHLTGGQHNQPKKSQWIPGSWEKLEIDPAVMYWVSEEPGSIDSFEFVGEKGNPRNFGGWMNYMQFARSPDGTPFSFRPWEVLVLGPPALRCGGAPLDRTEGQRR